MLEVVGSELSGPACESRALVLCGLRALSVDEQKPTEHRNRQEAVRGLPFKVADGTWEKLENAIRLHSPQSSARRPRRQWLYVSTLQHCPLLDLLSK